MTPSERLAATPMRRKLARARVGSIEVEFPSGGRLAHVGDAPGPAASLRIERMRGAWRAATRGEAGLVDGWIDGDWTTPDLTSLIEWGARQDEAFFGRALDLAPLRAWHRLRHRLRANTRRGSRANVIAHYDLGNDFYRAWLDEGMVYSSARWDRGAADLEEAQRAKLAAIVERLDLRGGERVLEIGCGWGALAAAMAEAGAARVQGLTLSPAQLDFARAEIGRRGLSDRVALDLRDYRDETGTFDRIASVEMAEAVGEAFLPGYFRAIRQRLAAGGRAALQVITIADAHFDAYRRRADFIQRHVFPGGFLPSPGLLEREIAKAGLRLAAVETFAESYARTLAEWRRRFLAAAPRLDAMGYDGRFRRLWTYYLSYCEAGFRSGVIDVGLYTLEG